MNSVILAAGAMGLYLIAYHTYGKHIGKKLFKIDPANVCPSKMLEDGVDFVPTRKPILFGHHFTSIAGTGPIVGPAVAIIWGWVPALIWIIFGAIFMGAVHDFGAMLISLRNQGRSIGDVAADVINKRVRVLFLLIIFLLLYLHFKSLTEVLIVLLTIPFSLVGILPAHWAAGAFFTATSMIGFIAGAGIVVRNSIILVEFVQDSVAAGMPLKEAVILAGAIRTRPIFLTAVTAMAGMLMMITDPVWSGLSWALIFGITASTPLSLIVIPLLYYAVKVARGQDKQQAVEPAE